MSEKELQKKKERKKLSLPIFIALAAVASISLTFFIKRLQEKPKVKPEADIIAAKVEKVPFNDPFSPLWEKVPSYSIPLTQQATVKPMKFTTPKDPLKVKAVHDGEWIAFLLEWNDTSPDIHTIKTKEFRDACAVLLTNYPAPPEAWFMGTKDYPATILHWKADWQMDIDEGFQDLEKAFPNLSIDMYPPMKEAIVRGKPPPTKDLPEEARAWMVGWKSGNPLSLPDKKSPVEKLIGIGPGSLTPLPTQDASGKGIWKVGVWRVVLSKKMKGSDSKEGEINLLSEKMYSVAFTLWSGHEGDRGSRKNPSMLKTLYIE